MVKAPLQSAPRNKPAIRPVDEGGVCLEAIENLATLLQEAVKQGEARNRALLELIDHLETEAATREAVRRWMKA